MIESEFPGTPDAKALLRSKMDDSRRKRAESMSTGSPSTPLDVKGEAASPYHARNNQHQIRDGTSRINQYELAALRNDVQVMAMQREEDAKQRAEDSHIIRDIHEEILKLREQLKAQAGTQVETSRQFPEQQAHEPTQFSRNNQTELEGWQREQLAEEQTRDQGSSTSSLALSPAFRPTDQQVSTLVTARALTPASQASGLTFSQSYTKEVAPVRLVLPTPSLSQRRHRLQSTNLTNPEKGQTSKIGRRPGPPKNIARINVKAASANRKIWPWLESEVKTLFDIINELKRLSPTYPNQSSIVSAYNRRLRGVVQREGEMTNGGKTLTEDRQAPLRTVGGISAMMKCHGLQACQ